MVLSVNHPSPHVALVTFSEKTSRDTFSSGTIEDVVSTIDGLIEDSNTNAVVLTGTGKFFSAGGPVDKFDEAIDAGVIRELVESMTGHLHPLLLRMRRTPTVFVGAMNGAAAGGGLGLALSTDYRISNGKAKLAAAFFRLGLSPDGGTTWLLPRLVGLQKSKKFFFENQVWSSEEALEHGALDEIVPESELISRSIEVAEKWGSWSESSRRGTKQLLDASTTTFFETQLEFERQLMVAAAMETDFKEGVRSFLEKRDPNFMK
jgi:2-(1,2-epoxy-1,2-dihydrophenyl)acetyl-CoA isomerase